MIDFRTIMGRKGTPGVVFTSSALSLYLAAGVANITHHEMWRDELQNWMLVKECSSLRDIFSHAHYLGHPVFWYLSLYPITRIIDQPWAMQVFHLFTASAAVFILIRYAPFSRLRKLLLISGYFFIYEYSVISRNYIAGIFFVFLFCALYGRGRRNYILLSVVLFLAAQTSAFSAIIALTFGAAMLYEPFIDRAVMKSLSETKLQAITGAIIASAGIISAYLEIRPAKDAAFTGGLPGSFDMDCVLWSVGAVWRSYVPIPEINHNFWSTNIVSSVPLQAALSIIIVCFSLLLFMRKPVVLFIYSLGTFLLLCSSSIFRGYLRNDGHLFILFIACLWISGRYHDKERMSPLLKNLSVFFHKHRVFLIAPVLLSQLAAGIIAVSYDWVYPFSESKETAKYIMENRLDKMLIAGDIDFAVSPVAAYLNTNIYYPRTGRYGTYIVYDIAWMAGYDLMDYKDVLKRVAATGKTRKEDILLILNYPVTDFPSLELLRCFDESIVPDEKYCLYLWKYKG